MSVQTIPATNQQPLILVTRTNKDRYTAIKYWHSDNLGEIWSSTYKFSKTPSSVQWSTPKRVTPKNATVSILQYDQQTNSCTIEFILSSHKITSRDHLPMTVEEYASFALNPNHQFSHPQAHTIYLQLRGWLTPNQSAQFLQLRRNADKEEAPPDVPSFTNQPSYPSTIQQAFALVNPSSQTTTNQTFVTNTPVEPPTLTFVAQPTTPILIPNLQATNFRLPKSKPLPAQDCYVFLRVIPAGPQNRRREVFYAHPLNISQEQAYPISPLKSTVAILYCDTNPNSPTFNQPIIKSINVAASTGTELEIFINEHGANLSPTQLLHCTHGASPTHHNHTQQDNTMQTNQCKFCGSHFEAPNAKTLYCSPKCRIDYNAGKTFGAEPKRSGPPSKPATTQPSDAVTQEQFQALSAQVAQLVQILTPK